VELGGTIMQAMEEKPAEVATLQQKFGVEAFHRFLGAYAAAQAKSGVATLRHLLGNLCTS